MWGDSPNKPIATKFRSSVELADVINRAKFHLDQSRGFACGKSQNLAFAFKSKTVLTTACAAALAVMILLTLLT